MISIRKVFQNRVFESKIDVNVNKVIKEKLIQKYTVTIDGLMYQNQPFTKKYTWKEAKEYAQNLRLGGYSDWRLATKDEFKRLLPANKNGEYYIRKEFIYNLKGDTWFWSSIEKDSSSAWGFYFRNGNNFRNNNDFWSSKTDKFLALCVR